eukprot:4855333-Amphidinium_carterae.1
MEFSVPLLKSTGEETTGMVAFLLPHELIPALLAASPAGLAAFTEVMGLDATTLQHTMALKKKWGGNIIPIAFWQDGVPYSWDRAESLEVYSWSFPGLASPAERNFRFPFCALQHHHCSLKTHVAIQKILVWSMCSLMTCQWPCHGPLDQPYPRRKPPTPLPRAAV